MGIILQFFHAPISKLSVILILVVSGYNAYSTRTPAVNLHCPTQEYLGLLAKFPEDSQGEGIEPNFPGGPANQPMTYALVLSSEVLHFKACPNEESRRRIRLAVQWLLEHADADNDSFPGWGLPQAWDAFQDGTINPANQPYTITTALVIESLLDALSIPSFWTDIERENIRGILVQVSKRWCQSAWSEDSFGGYFWYSTNPNDAYFVLNSSAMLVGNLARLLAEHRDAFTSDEQEFIQTRIDKSAQGIINQLTWRDGAPFWIYGAAPPNAIHPNDLIHHGYILWGMELYRFYGGKVALPWSIQQALDSLTRFSKNGILYDYPQDVSYNNDAYLKPAILWSTGMNMAFEARWGSNSIALQDLSTIENYYGTIPNLHLWPDGISSDKNFYSRFAAHVLWGMAYMDFYTRDFQVYLPIIYLTYSSGPAFAP